LMLTAFRFNCFPNPNLRLFGFNHLWFWFILWNPRWGGYTGLPPVRSVWASVRPVRVMVRQIATQPTLLSGFSTAGNEFALIVCRARMVSTGDNRTILVWASEE
jgi:hypothetical protein